MSANEMPAAAPTLQDLQALKLAREAALLKQWTAGLQPLTPQEMAEIAHILPPDLLANPPSPSTTYRHEYEYYAQKLDYQLRNIKRLVALGKEARLICPLDDIARLPDWWEQMKIRGFMKQNVPSRVLEAAARCTPAISPAPALQASAVVEDKSRPPQNSSTPTTSAPSGAPGTAKINFQNIQSVGLQAALTELSIQLGAAQKELRDAREAGLDDVTINRRQKNFDTTLDSLRKTEAAVQSLQKANGDLAPVADFRKDLTTLATTLRGMMRRRAANVSTALAHLFNVEQLAAIRSAIDAEGEREQALFRSARHWRADDGSTG